MFVDVGGECFVLQDVVDLVARTEMVEITRSQAEFVHGFYRDGVARCCGAVWDWSDQRL